jgi:hypothetical protein
MHGDSVREHLEMKSASILKKWSRLIRETYPADVTRFLQDEGDRFANPVGHTISQETRVILDELLHGMDPEKLAGSLTEIIKIRTVQDFSPSRAVDIVFLLKQAVREVLAGGITGDRWAELLDFESRIDRLALLAFDIYMKCRENICEIRVNEVAAQRDMALRILAVSGDAEGTGEAG